LCSAEVPVGPPENKKPAISAGVFLASPRGLARPKVSSRFARSTCGGPLRATERRYANPSGVSDVGHNRPRYKVCCADRHEKSPHLAGFFLASPRGLARCARGLAPRLLARPSTRHVVPLRRTQGFEPEAPLQAPRKKPALGGLFPGVPTGIRTPVL